MSSKKGRITIINGLTKIEACETIMEHLDLLGYYIEKIVLTSMSEVWQVSIYYVLIE